MTTTTDQPTTVRETLARMDEGWNDFLGRIHALPSEHLERHIGDGWTRKQMLAHIGTWHDLTTERLGRFAETGEPSDFDEHEDVINARSARAAEGRTMGEVLQGMEDSYRRLRREVGRLGDNQLATHDGFAAAIIAGNSYGHYAQHLQDLDERSPT
jgi:DinB family protein